MEKRKAETRGRKPLPKTKRRSRKVFFRVTAGEYKALVVAAKRAGLRVSKFVSEIVRAAIGKGK